MQLTFYVALAGTILLYLTLWKYEMVSKNTAAQLRALRRKLAGDDVAAGPASGRSAAPELVPATEPSS
jgi:heme exporter protein C